MISNLGKKLSRTRENLKARFDELVKSGKTRDDILDELGESLILADVGWQTTKKIIEHIREKSKKSDSFARGGVFSLDLSREMQSIFHGDSPFNG